MICAVEFYCLGRKSERKTEKRKLGIWGFHGDVSGLRSRVTFWLCASGPEKRSASVFSLEGRGTIFL